MDSRIYREGAVDAMERDVLITVIKFVVILDFTAMARWTRWNAMG